MRANVLTIAMLSAALAGCVEPSRSDDPQGDSTRGDIGDDGSSTGEPGETGGEGATGTSSDESTGGTSDGEDEGSSTGTVLDCSQYDADEPGCVGTPGCQLVIGRRYRIYEPDPGPGPKPGLEESCLESPVFMGCAEEALCADEPVTICDGEDAFLLDNNCFPEAYQACMEPAELPLPSC